MASVVVAGVGVAQSVVVIAIGAKLREVVVAMAVVGKRTDDDPNVGTREDTGSVSRGCGEGECKCDGRARMKAEPGVGRCGQEGTRQYQYRPCPCRMWSDDQKIHHDVDVAERQEINQIEIEGESEERIQHQHAVNNEHQDSTKRDVDPVIAVGNPDRANREGRPKARCTQRAMPSSNAERNAG